MHRELQQLRTTHAELRKEATSIDRQLRAHQEVLKFERTEAAARRDELAQLRAAHAEVAETANQRAAEAEALRADLTALRATATVRGQEIELFKKKAGAARALSRR